MRAIAVSTAAPVRADLRVLREHDLVRGGTRGILIARRHEKEGATASVNRLDRVKVRAEEELTASEDPSERDAAHRERRARVGARRDRRAP